MIGWIDPRALDKDGKVLSPRGMAQYNGELALEERLSASSSSVWSDGVDPDPEEHQPSIRFSNCSKPLTPLNPSRSDTTASTEFFNHWRGGVDAKSGMLPPPKLISVLVVTDAPPVTGGSVISVPPWPSEVALKFPDVQELTKSERPP
jgi:hypothetical protein